MRALGVDWGGTRIGIAVGEQFVIDGEKNVVCSRRQPLQATGTLKKDAEGIIQIADQEGVASIVIGVPEYDGDSKGAKLTRMIAQYCRDFGWEVSEVNESMTTRESHEQLKSMGISAADRKSRIDGESACLILERFFIDKQ